MPIRLDGQGADSTWTVTRSAVYDVDGYVRSVAGIELKSVRSGPGTDPSNLLTITNEDLMVTRSEVGFPTRSTSTVGDDRVIVAVVESAGPGNKWCEIDLHPGAVLIYGPGAKHSAVNQPGLKFSFAITSHEQLCEVAESMHVTPTMPSFGEVQLISPTGATNRVSWAMLELTRHADNAHGPLTRRATELLRAMARAFDSGHDAQRIVRVRNRGIDSCHVVIGCIEYAEATGRIPSIGELCIASHVSERRLREAFVEEFDQPPSRFFRNWALTQAHRRLRASRPDEHSVTEIAADLGFGHLGRFAGNYRNLYGETPSSTLHSFVSHAS